MRVRYLGRQGVLTEHLKGLGRLDPKERPQAGKRINEAKQAVSTTFGCASSTPEELASYGGWSCSVLFRC